MITALPDATYNQTARDGDEFDKDGKCLKRGRPNVVAYSLDPAVWGDWWKTTPAVEAIRPASIDISTLKVQVCGEGAEAHLKICGVVNGARYKVQVTPDLSFQVKVTSR